MYFQVMTTSDGSSFAARASARRSFGGQQIELTIVLHGQVDARGNVTLAPEPVEEWRAL